MQLSVVGGARAYARAGVWMCLGIGALVSVLGCAGDGTPTAPVSASPTPRQPSASAHAALSATPTQPTDEMQAFEQGLVQRFDRSRVKEQELPGGAVLEIPNGFAGHAAVLVKGPDGKLRRECVSSAAEVTAVVKRVREGARP